MVQEQESREVLNVIVYVLLTASFWLILVKGPISSFVKEETIFVQDVLPMDEG